MPNASWHLVVKHDLQVELQINTHVLAIVSEDLILGANATKPFTELAFRASPARAILGTKPSSEATDLTLGVIGVPAVIKPERVPVLDSLVGHFEHLTCSSGSSPAVRRHQSLWLEMGTHDLGKLLGTSKLATHCFSRQRKGLEDDLLAPISMGQKPFLLLASLHSNPYPAGSMTLVLASARLGFGLGPNLGGRPLLNAPLPQGPAKQSGSNVVSGFALSAARATRIGNQLETRFAHHVANTPHACLICVFLVHEVVLLQKLKGVV